MTVRMIRKAQVASSDRARVQGWIAEYTACQRSHAPDGVGIDAYMEAYGAYGVAYWTVDAPSLGELDAFLDSLTEQPDYLEILKKGSELFVSGMTSDTLLKKIG